MISWKEHRFALAALVVLATLLAGAHGRGPIGQRHGVELEVHPAHPLAFVGCTRFCDGLPAQPMLGLAGSEAEDRVLFAHFYKLYKRGYTSASEVDFRFANFREALLRVDKLNLEQVAYGGSPVYGVTKYSDWSAEERKTLLPGVRFPDARAAARPTPADQQQLSQVLAAVPRNFDWRTVGAITRVRNQGTKCGSCWAFSTMQTVESFWFLAKRGNLTELSAQQLVSCDADDDNCHGGFPISGYRYISKAGGLEAEKTYPYVSGLGDVPPCAFNQSRVAAKIDGFSWAESGGNEANLVQALVGNGPLSICIDAHNWPDYKSGVITSCGTWIDHCVQLVGYVNNPNGTKADAAGAAGPVRSGADSSYYIVKNSWDTDWGEAGYVNVAMGKNLCGIADRATYVRVNSP